MRSSSREAVIEVIMQNFDFHKVHKVMELLDWQWARVGKGSEVPSINTLREEARRLLESVKPGRSLASGGFLATDHSLRFIVEDFSWDY